MNRERWIIIFLAASIRIAIGWIFFGSIDLTVSMNSSIDMLVDGIIVDLPYFPIVPLCIWLGGILGVTTAMPLAFCFKIIPIIFDVCIASLVYDILRHCAPRRAFLVGVLYALSPVSIIITSLHGQWDSMCIFFLLLACYIREYYSEHKKKYILFGVCFAFSFLVKPVALMFFPLLLPPWKGINHSQRKNYVYNLALTGIGVLGTLAIACVVFILMGYNISKILLDIFAYSKVGVQIFGLRFTDFFIAYPILRYRLYLEIIVLSITYLYYVKKISIFDAIIACFTIAFGLAGWCPQYLFWLIPFLLAARHYRFVALYTLTSSLLLMLYYGNPYVSNEPWENMMTFSTLHGFEWLMPPLWFANSAFVPWIKFIGNCIIPLFCLYIAVYILITAKKSIGKNIFLPQAHRVVPYTGIGAFVITSIAIAYLSFPQSQKLLFTLRNVVENKYIAYNTISHSGHLVGLLPYLSPFNIIFIATIGALVWTVVAFSLHKHSST